MGGSTQDGCLDGSLHLDAPADESSLALIEDPCAHSSSEWVGLQAHQQGGHLLDQAAAQLFVSALGQFAPGARMVAAQRFDWAAQGMAGRGRAQTLGPWRCLGRGEWSRD